MLPIESQMFLFILLIPQLIVYVNYGDEHKKSVRTLVQLFRMLGVQPKIELRTKYHDLQMVDMLRETFRFWFEKDDRNCLFRKLHEILFRMTNLNQMMLL